MLLTRAPSSGDLAHGAHQLGLGGEHARLDGAFDVTDLRAVAHRADRHAGRFERVDIVPTTTSYSRPGSRRMQEAPCQSMNCEETRAPVAEIFSSTAGPWPSSVISVAGKRTRRRELARRPGVYCAGEMVDWEAPTGGYLLTACLASGWCAGQSILTNL